MLSAHLGLHGWDHRLSHWEVKVKAQGGQGRGIGRREVEQFASQHFAVPMGMWSIFESMVIDDCSKLLHNV